MARDINNSWTAFTAPTGKTITNYSLENNGVEIAEVASNVLSVNNISVPDAEINTRVRAKYDDNSYSAYSNVVTVAAASASSSILFSDTFDGTTIDTTVNWNQNTAGSPITFAQNGEIQLTMPGSNGQVAFYENNIISKNSFVATSPKYLRFSIKSSNKGGATWFVGFSQESDPTLDRNKLGFQAGASLRWNTKIGTSNNLVEIAEDITSYAHFKVRVTNTSIQIYKWSGTAWVLWTPEITHTLAGPFYALIGGNDRNGNPGNIQVDDFYITDADFTGLIPS